jgi:hypothetical protein
LRAWFSSLGDVTQRVVKVVIAAGAVATSIGAIVALWPDPDPPPAILDAEFSDVTVDENVALGDFKSREKLEGSAARGTASAYLAAITLPQPSLTQTVTTQTDTTETTETTESTETDTTETDTTETDTTQTDTTETTGEDEPGLTPDARKRVNEALGEALRNPGVGPIDIGDTCQTTPDDDDCAMKALAFKAPEESAAEVAERLVKFFKEVRKRQLTSGVAQPLGVIVNYKLTVKGYRGRVVRVRWQLYREDGGGLPQDWLKRQRPESWEAEADQDSVSPNVWVPLPPSRGPFYVRLIAEREDGVRLASRQTTTFE